MEYNIVTSNTLCRVFRISVGADAGTGFVIDVEKGRFLITAKHLFENVGYPAQIDIGIQHEDKWDMTAVEVFYHADSAVDIAVVKTDYFIGRKYGEVKCSSEGMTLSQDVFMLGFPYGFSTNQYDVNNEYPIPMVKKGVFSGVRVNGNIRQHWIDWDNNQGFSGGPVVFRKYKEQGYSEEYIAGVIHGYKGHLIKVYNPDGSESGLYTHENSGIGIMYNIKYVLEAIEAI